MSANKPIPLAIGIVYDKDGKPKVEEDFIKNLPPALKPLVDKALQEKGYKIKQDLTGVELIYGNT